ncbi:hypothetical protein [Actinoplanes sp. NPDC049265]|uniref:hypothetical protein n=1 Tax=Actinoplanes sp. NPDC049265 TaxID=3363902 RepID=UPI0037146CC0
MTDIWVKDGGLAPRRRRAQLNWLLTALPAFPLVLLVLRLWYLSRQDLPTMLLLVQYISPLGMISALGITLIWAVPAVILVLRALGGMLLVSAPAEAGRSMLAVTALRMPDWVVLLAAGLAGLTWQLRLLPVLLMLVVSIMGLTAVQRFQADRWLIPWVTLGAPILVGLLVLLFVAPGIRDALGVGEYDTALLLGVPPLLGPLLTGPVPARAARFATHWPAVGATLIAPLVVGLLFLRAPVLPNSAVEIGPAGGEVTDVVRGQLIAVDDTSTTMLGRGGQVTFVANDQVRSKTLCPEPVHGPDSVVVVRGWAAEASALSWLAPAPRLTNPDPRCLGRPLAPR